MLVPDLQSCESTPVAIALHLEGVPQWYLARSGGLVDPGWTLQRSQESSPVLDSSRIPLDVVGSGTGSSVGLSGSGRSYGGGGGVL